MPSMRTGVVAVATAVVGAAVPFVMAGPAGADTSFIAHPVSLNHFVKTRADTKHCLDADLSHIRSNGTKVQLWDCNYQTQQYWTLDPATLEIKNGYGRCLDADATNGRNGTKVQLWDCNGQRQQQWSQQTNHELVNGLNNMCLDADRGTIGRNGTKIQLWTCNDQDQQLWD